MLNQKLFLIYVCEFHVYFCNLAFCSIHDSIEFLCFDKDILSDITCCLISSLNLIQNQTKPSVAWYKLLIYQIIQSMTQARKTFLLGDSNNMYWCSIRLHFVPSRHVSPFINLDSRHLPANLIRPKTERDEFHWLPITSLRYTRHCFLNGYCSNGNKKNFSFQVFKR